MTPSIQNPKSKIQNHLRSSASICVPFLIFICLLAFTLRVYQLDGQSMWNDEGLSLHRAGLSLGTIASNVITVDGFETTDTNPPLYFFLLHFWRIAAGETVFVLRYLGVLFGLLSVPLIYRLGRLAFGRGSGMVAAGLLALSPFHVWQSQEMRNYGLLITFNLVSVYALLRFVLPSLTSMGSRASEDKTASKQGRWFVLWAAAGLLGIYTHYFGFFVFAFGVLALIGLALRRHWWRQRVLWIGLVVAGLLLLPVLPVALGRLQAGQQSGFDHVPPLHILSHALSVYTVGFRPTVVQPWWRVGPVVGLAAAGIIGGLVSGRSGHPRRVGATLLLVGYLVIPLVILILLSIVNPLYNGPRHLLIGLPPFLLLMAAAIGRINNSTYKVLIAALLVFTLYSQANWLKVQFRSPELIKDDLRGAAEWISQTAGPDDVVVLHDALIRFAFEPYYQGEARLLTIPAFASGDEAAAIAALEAAGQAAGRVWFVSQPEPRDGFPADVLPRWANRHWPRLLSRAYPHIWLAVHVDVYAPQPMTVAAEEIEPALTWDNGLGLLDYNLPATAAPGEVWWPTFDWQIPPGEAAKYSVSLRLLDEEGELWLQSDQPLWPAGWESNELTAIRRDFPVALPAGLPPGSYQVWLRLLGENGQPVSQSSGEVDSQLEQSLLVESVNDPAIITRLPAGITPLSVGFGRELELIGYQLPAGTYRPGHLLLFDLYWRGRRTPAADYQLRLQLVDAAGRPSGENIMPLTRADYRPSQWRPGEILRSPAYLVIPANVEGGSYTVHVSLVEPESQQALAVRQGWGTQESLVLGQAVIDALPIETEFPAIETPLRADFGEPAAIELHGYYLEGVAGPGQTMGLTLYWRAAATTDVNYVVFVHLVVDGEPIGQGDGQPGQGFRPTNSWRVGEAIVDEHSLTIGTAATPGRYSLWIGLYHPETGERLPIFLGGIRQPDDRLLLQEIVIP